VLNYGVLSHDILTTLKCIEMLEGIIIHGLVTSEEVMIAVIKQIETFKDES